MSGEQVKGIIAWRKVLEKFVPSVEDTEKACNRVVESMKKLRENMNSVDTKSPMVDEE